MEQTNNTQLENNSSNSTEIAAKEGNQDEVAKVSALDTQVKVAGASKRKFTAHYKQQIIDSYNACNTTEERGALLRKEGLYSSHITKWRKLFSAENDTNKVLNKAKRTEHLVAEIDQLKKKLSQAQAIIDLQKKVSELLGTYILPHDNKGGKS